MKNVISLKTNAKVMDFLRYLGCFLLMYILSKASINNSVFVFGFGIYFALVWCNQNVFIMSSLYLLSTYLANFSLVNVILALSSVIVLLIVQLIHQKIKKPIRPYLFVIYALIAQGLTIFYEIYYGANIIVTSAGLVLGLLFMLACMNFFASITTKGLTHKLSALEIISGACVLVMVSSGLTNLNIYGVEIVKIFASFILLVCVYSFGGNKTITISGLVGLGTLLATKNAYLVAPFLIWGFLISIFKVRNKFLPCIVLILTEAGLGLALDLYYSYTYINIISVVVGALLFLIIPENVFSGIKGLLELKEKQTSRNIVNRSRETLSRRFTNLADVFGEMDSVYRNMIKGGLDREDAKNMFISELKEKICSECSERSRCHRTFANDTENIFNSLAECALQRGKVTLLDIPPFLTARCQKLNVLVGFLNQTCQQYKNYADIMNNLDNGKILIADQLRGVSKIMKSLAKEINTNITFDTEREDKIIDELAYYDIVSRDVILYEENVDIVSVNIVVREEDASNDKIDKVVSKVCDSKMEVVQISPSTLSGWQVVTLKSACKYNLIFGTACCKKESSKSSGDSYSLIRLESDKFLLALCDGMGSGEKARKTSNLSISLVENFYKAGFDNEIILSSVNKLLALTKDDNFSALDMCILDMRKGTCDFIKLGAPEGFIKREETTEVVESGALPLGILEEIKPMIKKSVLSCGDMIILMSDGIVDAFERNEDMSLFINNLETLNPQTVADKILERAKELSSGGPQDDMTVLVAKIY